MPDPIIMGKAFAVAMVLAMATAFIFRRSSRPIAATAGTFLAIAFATSAGLWILNLWPHLPPNDVLDRLLVIVLPAAALAELVGAIWNKLGWLARGLVAMLTAPVLLHGSAYVTDLSGADSREWSPQTAILICAAGGLALLGAWAAMSRLAVRTQSRTALWVMAGVLLAAGVVVMLSGYATGGQLAVPLAASLIGIGVASESVLGIG